MDSGKQIWKEVPMKVALCLSGELRDFEYCWESIYENIVLPTNADVYVHTWSEPISTPRYSSAPAFQTISVEDFFATVVKPTDLMIESFASNWKLHKRPIARLSSPMYYSIWRANELKKKSGIDYDVVIRTRFDNEHYDKIGDECLNRAANERVLFVDSTSSQDYICLDGSMPWCNSGLPHIPDTFAMGNSEVMDIYSDLYLNIDDHFTTLLMNGHNQFFAEEFLGYHIWIKNGIPVERCNIKYAFLIEWNSRIRIHKEWI